MRPNRTFAYRSARYIARFARDEDGVMTAFAIMMFLMMLLMGGIGVDLMRNEMERVRLQNVIDRAVLAAADLDQILDPEAVVADYFEKADMAGYTKSVSVEEGLNYRIVSTNASTESPTQFMGLMGIESLPVLARSEAEERIQKVEISMVLDISGSMANNSKLVNLRDAANVFVETVIRPETTGNVSLSLVPYSEHVNAGPNLYNQFLTTTRHNLSHCMEIPASEFTHAHFDFGIRYDQMQHYQWNYSSSNSRTDTVCPRYAYERITPFSQNATALKQQIAQFQPRAGTSIFLGMKWGVGLLDPSMRSVVTTLASANVVDNEFVGRPVDYTDDETLKTIVLMTDGKNDRSHRIANWAYNEPNDYAHWKKYNFWYFLYNYVSSYNRQYYYEADYYTASQGDIYLDQICNAAKAKGIIIWSIGFEVDNHGAAQMLKCATSPSHYFRVEGVEIKEAFKAIARTINQLRLTQ